MRSSKPALIKAGLSTGSAMTKRVTNIIGVKKNRDAKGLDVAGFLRRRIWTSDHRRPEKNEAVMSKMKPMGTNAVSPATIMMTPTVMSVMIPNIVQEAFSSRKRIAKPSTKPRVEDLHIAV